MPDLTWTRVSDRWPPANTANIAVKLGSNLRCISPFVACSSENAVSWIGDGIWTIHPDDLYLILPAVPEEGK